MIFGYLCLGGDSEIDFSAIGPYEGQPIGPHRGRWRMETGLRTTTLSIPSRDKQVQLFYSCGLDQFAAKMAGLDAEPGPNYKAKLGQVVEGLPSDFVGVVNTLSTNSTHHSLAVMTVATKIHVYGLFDTQASTAYLFWSDDPRRIHQVIDQHPLRFLLYRFPILNYDAMFMHIEILCAQWRDWMRKSNFSALLPFNALERRLFGHRVGA